MANLLSLNGDFRFIHKEISSRSQRSAESVQRLSSGNRLSRASTDIVATSVSTTLQARVSSLRAAQNNVAQAASLLDVADGALANMQDALVRMSALSTQANSGVLTRNERAMLDIEFQTLKDEISTIANQTEFNGRKLFVQESGGIETITTGSDFTPQGLADNVVWFDASDASTLLDGNGVAANEAGFTGQIATWTDKSGNSNDISQGNAAERPVYVAGGQNGNGVVRFDGNNDRLPGTANTSSSSLSTFMVFTRTGGGGSREAIWEFGSNGEGSRNAVFLFGSNPRYYDTAPTGGIFPALGQNLTYNQFSVLSTTQQGNDLDGYLDGNQALNVSGPNYQRQPTTNFVLGDDSTSGDEIHGDIAEFIAFDRSLAEGERQLVESYLADKWDLNLAPAHPLANSAPRIEGDVFSNPASTEEGTIIGGFISQLGNVDINYRITGGNDDNAFTIDTSSGDILINDAKALQKGEGFYDLDIEADVAGVTLELSASIRLSEASTLSFQIGNDASNQLSIDFGDINLETMFGEGNTGLNIATQENATEAFELLKQAQSVIAERRAYGGSLRARTDVIASGLDTARTNQDAARGQLADTDIAAEATERSLNEAGLQMAINMGARANELYETIANATFSRLDDYTNLA